MQDLATEFESERDHLMAVAYRMLGSRTEAEDAVQEAWLRYAGALADPAARAEVRDLRAWLTTTTGRICLDVLRSARVRREAYPGQWLPEPVVARLPGAGADPRGPAGFAPDPAERAVATDQVGLAMLVLLERLSPEQRVAFVLHDVFAVPFPEVATVLGSTPAAARQLASRARRAVADRNAPRHAAPPAEQRRVVAAFLAAAQSGDFAGLVEVLAPDVVFVGDGGGRVTAIVRPINGAEKVARFTQGLFRRGGLDAQAAWGTPVLVNGDLGLHIEADLVDGRRVRFVMSFAVEDGRITGIFNQLNPDKLARVPAIPPEDRAWPPRL